MPFARSNEIGSWASNDMEDDLVSWSLHSSVAQGGKDEEAGAQQFAAEEEEATPESDLLHLRSLILLVWVPHALIFSSVTDPLFPPFRASDDYWLPC